MACHPAEFSSSGPGMKALPRSRPVGSIDLVVLMGLRTVNAVRLLCHHVNPTALVSPGKTGVRTAPGHVVEHGYVFCHPDRIVGRQHDPKLSHPQPAGLHADKQVQQHRIVGKLESLRMEMVLGKAHRVVPEIVREARLL
jgi:hypothetical protein